MASSDAATLGSLERIHQRIVITDDSKLEAMLSPTLLPGLIALLAQSAAVRSKAMGVLQHVLKRLKSPDLATMRLPTEALATLLRANAGGAASPFVRNFALHFLTIAARHTPRREQAALVGTLLRGFATAHVTQRHAIFRLVLNALPHVAVPASTPQDFWDAARAASAAEADAAAATAAGMAGAEEDEEDEEDEEEDAMETDDGGASASASAYVPPPPPPGSREHVLASLVGRERDPRDRALLLAMLLDVLLYCAPNSNANMTDASVWVPPGLSVAAMERLFGPKRALPSSTELDLWKPAVLAFVTSGLFETNFKGSAQPLEGGGILPHILVAASEARGDLASRAKAMLKALAGGNGGGSSSSASSSSAATAASRAAEGGESGGAGGAAGATSTRSGDAAVARREASTPTLLRWLQEESVVLALVVLATGDPGRGGHSSRSPCSAGVASSVMRELCRSHAASTSVRCLKPILGLVFGAFRADAATRRLALLLATHCVNSATKTLKVWGSLVLKATPPVLEAALRASSGIERGGEAAQHCAVAEATLSLITAVARRHPLSIVAHAKPSARSGILAMLFKIAVRVKSGNDRAALVAEVAGGAAPAGVLGAAMSSASQPQLVLGATTVFALIRALEAVAAAHVRESAKTDRTPLRALLFEAAASRSAVARRAAIGTLALLFSSRDLEVRFLALTLAADSEASVRDAAAECAGTTGSGGANAAAADAAIADSSAPIATLAEERERRTAASELPPLPELFAFLWSPSGGGSSGGSNESPAKRAKLDAAAFGLSDDAASHLMQLASTAERGERTRLSTLSVPSLHLLLDFVAQCVDAAATRDDDSAETTTTTLVAEGGDEDAVDGGGVRAGDSDASDVADSATVRFLRASHASGSTAARCAVVAYAATLDSLLLLTPAGAAARRLGGDVANAVGLAAVETQPMSEALDAMHSRAAAMLATLTRAVPLLPLALHENERAVISVAVGAAAAEAAEAANAEAAASADGAAERSTIPACALTRFALRSRVGAVRASLARVVTRAASSSACDANSRRCFTLLQSSLCAAVRAVAAEGACLTESKVAPHIAHSAARGSAEIETLLSGAHLDSVVQVCALLVAAAADASAPVVDDEVTATVRALARFAWSRSGEVRSAATAAVAALARAGLLTTSLQLDVAVPPKADAAVVVVQTKEKEAGKTAVALDNPVAAAALAKKEKASAAKKAEQRLAAARAATPSSPETTTRAALAHRLFAIASGGGVGREADGAVSCLVALHSAERKALETRVGSAEAGATPMDVDEGAVAVAKCDGDGEDAPPLLVDLSRHIEDELIALANDDGAELVFLAGSALAQMCASSGAGGRGNDVLARLLPLIVELGGGVNAMDDAAAAREERGSAATKHDSGSGSGTASSASSASAKTSQSSGGSSSLRKRRSAAVWLLCLAANPSVATSSLWRANRRAVQQSLIRLLVDETDVAREASAKAMLLIWESVCADEAAFAARSADGDSDGTSSSGSAALAGFAVIDGLSPTTALLGDLTRALTGGSSTGSAFQATRTTEASAAAATARELCQLVQELDAPALLYDLLARVARNHVWSPQIGRALRRAMVSTRTRNLFKEVLPKLLPRLFWYRHHPTKGVRLAMRELWLRLVGVGEDDVNDAIANASNESARDRDDALMERTRSAMESGDVQEGLRAAQAAAAAAQAREAAEDAAASSSSSRSSGGGGGGKVSVAQAAAAAAVGARLIATIGAALAALGHQRNWRHCTAGAYALADLFAAGGAVSSSAAASALSAAERAALDRTHAGALLGSDAAMVAVLPRVWRGTLLSLDAMEPRIQAAGLRAFRELSRFTMRHCNVVGEMNASSGSAGVSLSGGGGGAAVRGTRGSVSAASIGTARALLAATLPWILSEGLNHANKLARQLAVLTLRDLVRCAGPLVAPHVVSLVPALLRAVSSLEPGVLAYLQSHANDEVGNAAEAASANDFGVAMGRGDVERLRSDVARASPMEEALSLCVRHTDWRVAKKNGFVPDLAAKLAALVRSSVGASFLATRTSTSRFIVAFAAAAPKSAVKAAGVPLLRALLDGVRSEKESALVRRGFVEAAGALAKHGAKSGSVGKFVEGIVEMHRNALAGTKVS